MKWGYYFDVICFLWVESNKPDKGFRLRMWLYVCSCILQINIFELSWVNMFWTLFEWEWCEKPIHSLLNRTIVPKEWFPCRRLFEASEMDFGRNTYGSKVATNINILFAPGNLVTIISVLCFCWYFKITYYQCCYAMAPFYYHGFTLIPAWISNYTHWNVWDKITYPFLNFNGATVEV